MWKLSPKKAKCNDVFSADEFDRAVAVEAFGDGKLTADSAKLADLIILPNGKKRGHQSLKNHSTAAGKFDKKACEERRRRRLCCMVAALESVVLAATRPLKKVR